MDNEAKSSISWQSALDYIQEQNLSGALEILLEMVGYDPDNIALINLLSDCYYYLGEFDRAKACWDEILRLNPANQEAKSKLGRYRTPSFQSWLKRYKQALYNIEQKNYELALRILRDLMEENDGFVSVYQFLGLCYMAQSEFEQARLVWQKGLGRDRGNATLVHYLQMLAETQPAPEPVTAPVVQEKAGSNRKASALPGLPLAGALLLAVCLLLVIKFTGGPELPSSNKTLPAAPNQSSSTGSPPDLVSDEIPVFSEGLLSSENSQGGAEYDSEQESTYYREGFQAYREGNFKQAENNLRVVVAMQSDSYLNREALYYLALFLLTESPCFAHYFVNNPIFHRFFGGHEIISFRILLYFFQGLAGSIRHNPVQRFSHSNNSFGMNLNVCSLTLSPATRLMNHYFGIG
jgi:tetratricopeptide (TPR) repeat protein